MFGWVDEPRDGDWTDDGLAPVVLLSTLSSWLAGDADPAAVMAEVMEIGCCSADGDEAIMDASDA